MDNFDLINIVNRCKDNDRQAQEILYKEYFILINSIAYRYIKDTQKKEELVNDIFLRIFKKINKFNFEGSFEGWIKIVAKNLSLSYIDIANKKSLRTKTYYYPDEVIQSISKIVNSENNLIINEILNAIKLLPNQTRKVIELIIEGYKHREIADKLNIAEGTSKWHLSEARSILQNKISNYTITS